MFKRQNVSLLSLGRETGTEFVSRPSFKGRNEPNVGLFLFLQNYEQ